MKYLLCLVFGIRSICFSASCVGRKILISNHFFALTLDFVVDQMQAVKFALDIACGMAFLHTLEPMIPRHYLNSKSVMVGVKSDI